MAFAANEGDDIHGNHQYGNQVAGIAEKLSRTRQQLFGRFA